MIKHSYKYSNRISRFFHFTTRGIDLLPLIDPLTRSIYKPAFLTLSLKSEKNTDMYILDIGKNFVFMLTTRIFVLKASCNFSRYLSK